MGFKVQTRGVVLRTPSPGYGEAQPSKRAVALLNIGSTGLLEPGSDGSFSQAFDAVESGVFDDVINSWSPNHLGESLLQLAMYTKDLSLVEACLRHGASPERSRVATHSAARLREEPPIVSAGTNPKLLRLLLRYGAKVDGHLPHMRRTALFMAAERENRECIEILLGAGADPLFESSRYGTPFARAKSYLEGKEPSTFALFEAAVEARQRDLPLVRTSKGKHTLISTRGVREFVSEHLDAENVWKIVLAAAPLQDVSKALVHCYRGSRRISSAWSAIAEPAGRAIVCVRFSGMPWTVCYELVGQHHYPRGHKTRSAQGISKRLHCDTVAFGTSRTQRFKSGQAVFDKLWDFDVESVPESNDPDVIEEQQLAEMDAWFAGLDILVPVMRYESNGAVLWASFPKLRREDVVAVDVVITR